MPFLRRAGRITFADGKAVRLTEAPLSLTAEEIGGYFTHAGLRVSVPSGGRLLWPAWQHNPYTKDGKSSLADAKLVLVLPFTDAREEYRVDLSLAPAEKFPGQAFEARDLPFTFTGAGYTKRLDDLGSQFLGATGVGDTISFELPELAVGEYELLSEFVLADVYGTVRVLLDGKAVGEPFDAYCPGVDSEGERVSFGTVTLLAGRHQLTVEVVGKNPQATQYFISVKRWLLRPL